MLTDVISSAPGVFLQSKTPTFSASCLSSESPRYAHPLVCQKEHKVSLQLSVYENECKQFSTPSVRKSLVRL